MWQEDQSMAVVIYHCQFHQSTTRAWEYKILYKNVLPLSPKCCWSFFYYIRNHWFRQSVVYMCEITNEN